MALTFFFCSFFFHTHADSFIMFSANPFLVNETSVVWLDRLPAESWFVEISGYRWLTAQSGKIYFKFGWKFIIFCRKRMGMFCNSLPEEYKYDKWKLCYFFLHTIALFGLTPILTGPYLYDTRFKSIHTILLNIRYAYSFCVWVFGIHGFVRRWMATCHLHFSLPKTWLLFCVICVASLPAYIFDTLHLIRIMTYEISIYLFYVVSVILCRSLPLCFFTSLNTVHSIVHMIVVIVPVGRDPRCCNGKEHLL